MLDAEKNCSINFKLSELKRSINKTRSLIESYNVLLSTKSKDEPISNDEVGTKLLADIRTNLKSINWDIQDLEETISKFKFEKILELFPSYIISINV